MRNLLLASSLSLAFPLTALADTIGFEIGAYQWQQQFEGTISTTGDLGEIDVERDLGFDDENGMTYYALIEHPVPIIPNILLSRTELEVDASSTLSRSIVFDDQIYNVNADIESQVDLSHTDLTLYYEILDNWVNLDIGLTARLFDNGFKITDGTDTAEEEFDYVIPLLYVSARFDLPLTGFYVGATANGLSVGDASLLDYLVNVGYESELGLGVELGMRKFDLDYEDDDDIADLSVDGGYLGIYYHF